MGELIPPGGAFTCSRLQTCAASDLPDWPASKVSEGTFNVARIPHLGNAQYASALLIDGSRPMIGTLDMAGHPLYGVPTPVLGSEATNKNYVDTLSGSALLIDGSRPMIGTLDMAGHPLYGVPTPVLGSEATNKNYVDTLSKALANVLYSGVSWDESQATGGYTRTGLTAIAAASPPDCLIPIQARMRRCVMSDAGVVQYYLSPTDSTKKSDGITASDLTGGDGQVMVEIPKFYHRYSYAGTTHTHDISLYPLDGFTVHNAFVKNGTIVDYRYIGAYEGVLYDASELAYANGIYQTAVSCVFANADKSLTIATRSHWASKLAAGDKIVVSGTTTNDGTLTVATIESGTKITVDEAVTDQTAAATVIQTEKDWVNDKLSSVSGKASINYGTRANFRAVAAKRGTGWRQQDFDLVSAIQLLYLVEYADWNSQSMIGNGLTDWTSAWPAWNDYNPINFTGLTNALGNATGNLSNGDGVVGSYMSYRGIENFFGHLWKWVDGINITDRVPWVSNTDTQFADDTITNYTSLGVTLATADEYVVTLEQIARGFLAASVTGSGSTYVTDYYLQNSGWRVAQLGAYASDALRAGVACWAFSSASDGLDQAVSGRLAF